MFLGIPDPGVWSAYVLCVLASLLCLAWGAYRWNQGNGPAGEPVEEVRRWVEEEEKVEETL